jgi:inactivated superfamily I helicase
VLETISIEDYSDIKVIEYVIHDNLNNFTIPFKGDFDQGLQIMGLLETRGLDFENVIMLSVNEGILPKGKTENSLILYNVKKHFKLPTYEQKDSVYAYHFFRLLQRAKNVFLIYNNDSSDSLAEKSRFINQLEFEIKSRKSKIMSPFVPNLYQFNPTLRLEKQIILILLKMRILLPNFEK